MYKHLKSRLRRILRWSEKYTKTDMVYLTQGGFWLTVGQTTSSLSVFALAIAFANLVSPELYGTYKYILSVAGMFAIFTLPGMNTALMRAVAQGKSGALKATTRTRIKFSFVGVFAASLVAIYYFLHQNESLAFAFLIIAATLPLFDTFTGYMSFFAGMRRFDLQSGAHFTAQLISVGSIVCTLLVTDSILLILLSYFVPLILIRVFFYARTIHWFEKTTPAQESREVIIYGRHLTAMQILSIIAGNLDKILLWKFFGPVQLAIYTFAVAVPEQLKGPLKGVGDLAFPKFAAQTPQQVYENIPALIRKIALYALGLCVIAFLYIAAAPLIFKLLFPQYPESVVYSQIFALTLILGVRTIPATIITALKKVKLNYFLQTTEAMFRATALCIGIYYFGIAGAIGALLITYTLNTILIFAALLHTLRTKQTP